MVIWFIIKIKLADIRIKIVDFINKLFLMALDLGILYLHRNSRKESLYG